MISLAALRLLLRKVPGIAWAGIIVALLVAGAFWFTYRAGAVHEQRTAHRAALADSIRQESLVHETARSATDSARGVAHTAQRFADASRTKRQGLRDAVEDMLDDLPQPVVSLIHMDDQQIRRDSVALVAYVAVDTALVEERTASAELDRLRVNQAAIGVEPPKRHGVRTFVVGAAIGVASMLVLHAVR